jgi:hypothetical protein
VPQTPIGNPVSIIGIFPTTTIEKGTESVEIVIDLQNPHPFKMDNSLAGKVAVISGSDAGIGSQIARELSAAGANVVINYPNSDQVLVDRAAAVVSSLKTPGIAVEADISTTTGPQALVDAVVAAYGKIDILVNSKYILQTYPLRASGSGCAIPF